MFASFTSILSPALKEKLGIGPKSGPLPDVCSHAPKPLSLPANRTIRPLSSALQTEVQSPGFSSRLTSLVRDGAQPHLSDPGLSPLSLSVSPRYSRLGQLPVVTLNKKQLPRLTSRNSDKVGRREGRAPVMMRIAPQEPYSPFKRYSGSTERSAGGSRSRDGQGGSTDPRQVIAVLAELSGKRTRRPSDDISVTGSKRARRDSSSSLGSSLSMEMPPLFQNGVVGQSTSHLVSREADLSLGSLLSRNQSLFGHSPHHSHPLPPTSLSHHHTVPTANAQSQTVSAKPESSSDQALSLEIQASLSSSRCLLKRSRDEFEEESEDEENIPTPQAHNVFRSPDKESDKEIKKRRKSSEGSCKSCGSNNSTLVESDSKNGSPEASAGATAIVVASPAEILGTPAPKRRRTGQVIGEKELKWERELQMKRLGKMLEIFPDQKALALTPSDKSTEVSSKDETETTNTVSKTGGFAFSLGEKFDSAPPPAYDASKGGFPFEFGSKSAAEKTTESSVSVPPAYNLIPSTETTITTSTAFSLGNISSTSNLVTGNVGNVSTTSNAPDLVSKPTPKPATVTFNLSGDAATVSTKPQGAPVLGLPVPKFSEHGATESDSATANAPANTAVSTISTSTAVVSSSKTTTAPFTFGAANFAAPAVSTEKANVVTTSAAPPVFSFGSSKTGEGNALPAPSFSFPVSSSAATTTTANAAPTFSFGQNTTSSLPTFGNSTTSSSSASSTFSFGVTSTTTAAKALPATGLFSFGNNAVASTVAPTFGSVASTTTTTSVATVSPFAFGAAATTATTSASTGLFTFGSNPVTTSAAAPTPSFGSQSTAASVPSFGSTAPVTSVQTFNFGAVATTTTTTAPTGATFSFGGTNPATTTQNTAFTFGKAATEPPKPSFAFGGGNNAPVASNPFGAVTATAPFGATQAAAGFGAPSTNTFGAAVVSTSSNTFGAASVTKSASTGNVFSFGKPVATSQPTVAAASPFSFGVSNPAPAASTQAAASPFQFGSSTPAKPSFNFGGGSTAAAPPAFGATAAAPAFGSATAASAFGTAPTAAPQQQSGVFAFGASSTPAAAPVNSNTGFNFAAAPQSTSGVFNFGAAAPAAAPQANPFGAPANPSPAFGAPSANFGAPTPNFGATSPAFGGAPAPAPAGGSMFSIGAGGNPTRSSNTQRRIATARRTRKQ